MLVQTPVLEAYEGPAIVRVALDGKVRGMRGPNGLSGGDPEEEAQEEGRPAEPDGTDGAPADDADVLPAEEAPPPPPPLPEGAEWRLPVSCGKGGELSFKMPPLPGVGPLSPSIALNGRDFVPIEGGVEVYGPLTLETTLPSIASRAGGTTLQLRGRGIRPTAELTACFVKGEWRAEVPATFDETSGCAVCVTPPYGGSARRPEEEDDGDCIVELSLNGQQWSWSCRHFTFVPNPTLRSTVPAAGSIDGGTAVVLSGSGFRSSEIIKVRYVRCNLEVNQAAPSSKLADGRLNAAGDVECTTPQFEGTECPFEAFVQLSLDGNNFSECTQDVIFKFEPQTGKKKK
ncbi:MAG: hypothetical protein SGPRY_005181 [Prymnesium sp.]